jgi:chromosome segregation ATPase
MMASICLLAALAAPAADPVPPPLSEEQVTRVRTLVKTHQQERTDLKARLETAQQKLVDCYARFELDEEQVTKLQAEVLELQGKLLRSYHTMQTELRTIVGAERFKILSKRIDNALRPPEPKK